MFLSGFWRLFSPIYGQNARESRESASGLTRNAQILYKWIAEKSELAFLLQKR